MIFFHFLQKVQVLFIKKTQLMILRQNQLEFCQLQMIFKRSLLSLLLRKIMDVEIPKKLQDITIVSQSSIITDNLVVNLQIKSPQPSQATRDPIAVICVLDISGSMDTQATQGGAIQSDGFTRLDLVKHSVNTIINSLENDDMLGVVTFSDIARIDFQLVKMTEQNKAKALQMIAKMRTEGSTNLWGGIQLGLQLSHDEKCKDKNTFLVVLSDGEPNVTPPGGQLATTKQYIKNNPLTASMSMFGYGYSLDTKLLSGLAELGGGCFGYIPDCSMIGTIFVNFLSSALSSYSAKLQASIKIANGEVKDFNGQSGHLANLGSIQYGVTRNCVITFKGVPQEQQVGQVNIYFVQGSRQMVTVKLTNAVPQNLDNVKIQKLRNDHIELLQYCLQNAHNDINKCVQATKQHLARMKQVQKEIKQQSKYLDTLIRDIESQNPQQGQMLIALSKPQYWQKWGRHYFPALKIAHGNEMCTNFKDPGLQLYGGQLFRTYQGKIDTVFISLPPPIPSIQKYDANGNLKVVADMSQYYDEQGGCIHQDCLVTMANGQIKSVKQLKKGDVVIGINGPSEIKCVVKTSVNKTIEMVKFSSGLIITKYHPVFYNGNWAFPINISETVCLEIRNYYNFVLERGNSMLINNIPCITFGHQVQEQVARHNYFGTEKIIKDLSRLNGWNQGAVQVPSNAFIRDTITKEVIGMKI